MCGLYASHITKVYTVYGLYPPSDMYCVHHVRRLPTLQAALSAHHVQIVCTLEKIEYTTVHEL